MQMFEKIKVKKFFEKDKAVSVPFYPDTTETLSNFRQFSEMKIAITSDINSR